MTYYFVIICTKTGFQGTTHYSTYVEASRAAFSLFKLTGKNWDVRKMVAPR